MHFKKIFICSPLRALSPEGIARNQARAIQLARAAALQGHIPIVPHIYFTQFLQEDSEAERDLGIRMGIHLLSMCDELWVHGDPTVGMQMEIDHWEMYFSDRPLVWKLLEGV